VPNAAPSHALAPLRQASDVATARDVRSLGGLLPFVRPYRARVAAAALFLVLAAVSTLIFPVALKSLIDQGFIATDPGARVMLREHFFAFSPSASPRRFSAARCHMVSWLASESPPTCATPSAPTSCARARNSSETTQTGEVALAPDDRHNAGPDRRRLESVDGLARKR
jgi:ATP-binding cassette subfamily B protein